MSKLEDEIRERAALASWPSRISYIIDGAALDTVFSPLFPPVSCSS